MSHVNSPSDDLSSEADFRRALTALVHAARANGITVRGGWRIDGGDDPHDLGVEIYRTTKPGDE